MRKDSRALEYVSDELKLKAAREIVLKAVKSSGRNLQYASDELKSDREIVLEAVKQIGWALEYASDELRADREIVLEALKQGGKYSKATFVESTILESIYGDKLGWVKFDDETSIDVGVEW